ncbi:MAG: DUF3473 domain-containing protein [Sedimentisphaerales bacterium]|nr:DUF3473 domain-containing protein [Sedimentisphaerales bacterium]
MTETASSQCAYLISIDVEEYFQVEAAGLPPHQWDGYEKRLEAPINQLLELLGRRNALATFFILGWVAEHEPNIVQTIARAGHEIASHGVSHQMIHRLDPEQFRVELRESRRRLEDLSGKPVMGYRAPTFSVTRQTAWAVDILAEENYLYDSSVFPVHHDRYGVPDAPPGPHRAQGPAGNIILEIPPLTWRAFGENLPIGGGGYLRLFPVRLVDIAIQQRSKIHKTAAIYLHPWELDPGQPILPSMGRFSRWRHRVGLNRTHKKLDWLLQRYPFTTFAAFAVEHRERITEVFSYA